MHSTSKEAATIASKAQVGKLIIGHYSQRYFDLSPLLDEAQAVFPDTYLAIEGEKFELNVNMILIADSGSTTTEWRLLDGKSILSISVLD